MHFCAFWVCIDMHSNYFDIANKNYFRKIIGVRSAVMSFITSKLMYFELVPIFFI